MKERKSDYFTNCSVAFKSADIYFFNGHNLEECNGPLCSRKKEKNNILHSTCEFIIIFCFVLLWGQ